MAKEVHLLRRDDTSFSSKAIIQDFTLWKVLRRVLRMWKRYKVSSLDWTKHKDQWRIELASWIYRLEDILGADWKCVWMGFKVAFKFAFWWV